jgi:hypothetical protein
MNGNENLFRFSIYYEVPRRGETPAVIGAKFLQTLDALSRIDPLLARWKVLDRPTLPSVPLAERVRASQPSSKISLFLMTMASPNPNRDTAQLV